MSWHVNNVLCLAVDCVKECICIRKCHNALPASITYITMPRFMLISGNKPQRFPRENNGIIKHLNTRSYNGFKSINDFCAGNRSNLVQLDSVQTSLDTFRNSEMSTLCVYVIISNWCKANSLIELSSSLFVIIII